MHKSTLKPYNDRAGYIASLRSGANKGWVVIYLAAKQQLDTTDGKYVTVCETHNQMHYSTNLPRAREAMKDPELFCTGCRN